MNLGLGTKESKQEPGMELNKRTRGWQASDHKANRNTCTKAPIGCPRGDESNNGRVALPGNAVQSGAVLEAGRSQSGAARSFGVSGFGVQPATTSTESS